MQRVGKAKIDQKHSRPNITYPLIRLLREFAEIIGTPATIYQTRHEDSTASFVILGDNNKSLLKREAGQLWHNVGQPDNKNRLEVRLLT